MKTHKIKTTHFLKYAVVLGSAVLLNSLAYAEPEADKTAVPKKPEAETTCSIASEKSENNILSIAAADWNSDKRIDSAVLLKSGDQADLYIYLNNQVGNMELKLTKKNLVWSGALAGTLPQLRTAKGGVLLIYSQNDAVGRNRWHQRLTVDYRDNDFLVTGYAYDASDTLEPNSTLSCDVNLLTGKGVKDKTTFKLDKQKIKLSDWTDDKAPKQCRN